MQDRDIQQSEKKSLILPGILSLFVGLLFFAPGVIFTIGFISKILNQNTDIDVAYVFIATFPLAVGTILLFLSFQFFTGKVIGQSISRPVLFMLVVFFFGLGISVVTLGYIFEEMPTGAAFGRGVGAAFSLGFFSLWLLKKRKS